MLTPDQLDERFVRAYERARDANPHTYAVDPAVWNHGFSAGWLARAEIAAGEGLQSSRRTWLERVSEAAGNLVSSCKRIGWRVAAPESFWQPMRELSAIIDGGPNAASPEKRDPQWVCEIMDEWARLYGARNDSFRDAWRIVRLAIRKSSLLRRRLYLGEPLRTEKCPVHDGEWSGMFANRPEGCECYGPSGEMTGWIPVDKEGTPHAR